MAMSSDSMGIVGDHNGNSGNSRCSVGGNSGIGFDNGNSRNLSTNGLAIRGSAIATRGGNLANVVFANGKRVDSRSAIAVANAGNGSC